jgi:hypothetical protein
MRGVSSIVPWKTGRDWKLKDKHAAKKAKKEQNEREMQEKNEI